MRALLREVARGKSLLRANLNAVICPRIALEGMVVDLGCGAAPSYWGCLNTARVSHIIRVDLDRDARPSVLASLEKGLPLKRDSADAVLMFNILEHVFCHQQLLSEVHRVLKAGGTAHAYVPFMHKIHADPFDFFRYSAESLARLGAEAGFGQVTVEGFAGLFLLIHESLKVFVRGKCLKWLFAAACLGADRACNSIRSRFNSEFVVGYYARLTK